MFIEVVCNMQVVMLAAVALQHLCCKQEEHICHICKTSRITFLIDETVRIREIDLLKQTKPTYGLETNEGWRTA